MWPSGSNLQGRVGQLPQACAADLENQEYFTSIPKFLHFDCEPILTCHGLDDGKTPAALPHRGRKYLSDTQTRMKMNKTHWRASIQTQSASVPIIPCAIDVE